MTLTASPEEHAPDGEAVPPFTVGNVVYDTRRDFAGVPLTVRGIWPREDYGGGWKIHVEARRCDHCGGGPVTTARDYSAAAAYFQRAPTLPRGGFIEQRFARAL